jgi:hypothetical protein
MVEEIEDFKKCVSDADSEEDMKACSEDLREAGVQLKCKRKDILSLYVHPVKNRETNAINKPEGGLWTSSFTPFENYCSDWIRWMSRNMEDDMSDDCKVIVPGADAEILEIDDKEEYLEVLREYGIKGEMGTKGLDFEKLAEDYDGIRLTDEGEMTLGHPFDVVEELRERGIADFHSWDSESTVWFKNKFKGAIDIDDVPHTCETDEVIG